MHPDDDESTSIPIFRPKQHHDMSFGPNVDVHPAALAMYFQFLATFTKNIQCRHLIDGPQHEQEQYTSWQILIRSSAIPVPISFISFGNRHAV